MSLTLSTRTLIRTGKKEVWYSLLSQHRARFLHIKRTNESKDCLIEAKKSKKLTGSGKSPNEPNATQQKILSLCEETPGFTGMTGGTESYAEQSVHKDVEGSILDD